MCQGVEGPGGRRDGGVKKHLDIATEMVSETHSPFCCEQRLSSETVLHPTAGSTSPPKKPFAVIERRQEPPHRSLLHGLVVSGIQSLLCCIIRPNRLGHQRTLLCSSISSGLAFHGRAGPSLLRDDDGVSCVFSTSLPPPLRGLLL